MTPQGPPASVGFFAAITGAAKVQASEAMLTTKFILLVVIAVSPAAGLRPRCRYKGAASRAADRNRDCNFFRRYAGDGEPAGSAEGATPFP